MQSRFLTVLTLALVAASAAAATTTKDFKPGDVRVCGAARCLAVMSPRLAHDLASFVYSGPQPATGSAPAMGARVLQLRFRNPYVAGIFAASRLDRWLSYGVYLERFGRGRWYVVPPRTASSLRGLVVGLKAARLTPEALARSH